MDLIFKQMVSLRFPISKEQSSVWRCKRLNEGATENSSSWRTQQTHIKMSWLNLSPVSHGFIFGEMRSTMLFLITEQDASSCFSAGHLCWKGKFCFALTKFSWTAFSHFSQSSEHRLRQWVNYDVKFIYKNITFIWSIYKVN